MLPTRTDHVMSVSELDRDGDGRVSFKDFDFAMKYNVDDHFWVGTKYLLQMCTVCI